MAITIQSGSTPAEPYLLDLLHAKVDPLGLMLGGQRDAINFTDLPDAVAGGEVLTGKAHGEYVTIAAGFAQSGIAAQKGLLKTAGQSSALKHIFSGLRFSDMITSGDEPSGVVSVWITPKTWADAAGSMISNGLSTARIWGILLSANTMLATALGSNYTLTADAADLNKPHLVSFFLKRVSAGRYDFEVWFNKVRKARIAYGTGLNTGYPFPNPGTSANIGSNMGYGTTNSAVIHRALSMKVNPDTFDMSEWVAEEYDRNLATFTV